jgi:hypothetical protein
MGDIRNMLQVATPAEIYSALENLEEMFKSQMGGHDDSHGGHDGPGPEELLQMIIMINDIVDEAQNQMSATPAPSMT